jgi:hypothetical protein
MSHRWGSSYADLICFPLTVVYLIKTSIDKRKAKKKHEATIAADLDHGPAAQRWENWHEQKAKEKEQNTGKSEAEIEKEREEREEPKLTLLEEMTGKDEKDRPVEIVDTEAGKKKVYGPSTLYKPLPPKEERLKESGVAGKEEIDTNKRSMLDV